MTSRFFILVPVLSLLLGSIGSLAAPGDFDYGFGTQGRTDINFGIGGYGSGARDVALYEGGRIVTAGLAYVNGTDYISDFAVARQNPDGTLDTTFNGTGTVLVDFGSGDDVCFSVTIQPDGKIVLAGKTLGQDLDFALVRLNVDGSLDTSFNGTGKVILNLQTGLGTNDVSRDQVGRVLIQADGKIVVTGSSQLYGEESLAVVRLTADGSLDPSFGGTGRVLIPIEGESCYFPAGALGGDGKIVIGGGRSKFPTAYPELVLARIDTNGIPDPAFGTGGVAVTNFGAWADARDLVVLGDGKILVTGHFFDSIYKFGVAKYKADGSLDTSFDGDGRVLMAGFINSTNAFSTGIAVHGDGRIVVLGQNSDGTFYDLDIIQLLPTGALDPQFAQGGIKRVSMSNYVDTPVAAMIQPDGRIVAATTSQFIRSRMTITRVDGTPDTVTAPPGLAGIHVIGGPDIWSPQRNPVSIGVTLPETPGIYSAKLRFDDGVTPIEFTLSLFEQGTRRITFDPAQPSLSSGGSLFNGAPLPDGTYTVTLSYQDKNGNPPASVSRAGLRIDTTPPKIEAPAGGFTPAVMTTAQGSAAQLPDFASQAIVSDAGGTVTISQTPLFAVEGRSTVTLTAVDQAGNSASLEFEVEVRVAGDCVFASRGGSVPGAGVNPRISADAKWRTFGMPSIAAGGQSAGWMAFVDSSSSPGFQGIFVGPLQAQELKLKTGDAATNADGQVQSGLTFKSFRDPVFAGELFAEQFAVLATVQGAPKSSDTGIWFGEGDSLKLVVQEGSAVPGEDGAKFTSFTSVAMTSPGVVYFTAGISTPKAKSTGLWVWSKELGLKPGIRTGIGEPTITSVQALANVKGSPGHARYGSNPLSMDQGCYLLKLKDGGYSLGTLSIEGNALPFASSGPNGLGRTIVKLGIPSCINEGSPVFVQTTFAPDLASGITPKNGLTIYSPDLDKVVAQKGSPAPGAEPATFKSFLDPVAGTDFESLWACAFAAQLTGAKPSNDNGIWTQRGDDVVLVAREGDPPPGAPGTRWKSFTSLTVVEGRGAAFVAQLTSGSTRVNASNDTGFWATNSDGQLKLMIREGQSIDGKKLKSFNLLTAVASSAGQRRAWTIDDDSARVIYRAFFTDGSSAIVSTAIP